MLYVFLCLSVFLSTSFGVELPGRLEGVQPPILFPSQGKLWASVDSVLVARWSEVLIFESRTPFHGLATPSGGRHAVENGGLSPLTTGMKIGPVHGVTEVSPVGQLQVVGRNPPKYLL